MSEIERKAQHWEVIAGVVRDVDRAHRGGDGPGMHDDDLVDVAARALRRFPTLVAERALLQRKLQAESGDLAGAPSPDWSPSFEAGGVRWRRTGSTLEVCRLRRGWFWSFPGEEHGPMDLAWTAMVDANEKHPPSRPAGS